MWISAGKISMVLQNGYSYRLFFFKKKSFIVYATTQQTLTCRMPTNKVAFEPTLLSFNDTSFGEGGGQVGTIPKEWNEVIMGMCGV